MSDTNTLLARRVFDQLLADPDRRRRACELFHGAATVAAETADESWTLTVPRDGRRIHLNVGRFLAVGVARDGVSLILDVSGPDVPEAIAVERSTSGRDWVAKALDDILVDGARARFEEDGLGKFRGGSRSSVAEAGPSHRHRLVPRCATGSTPANTSINPGRSTAASSARSRAATGRSPRPSRSLASITTS